jgi:hypothetical protein
VIACGVVYTTLARRLMKQLYRAFLKFRKNNGLMKDVEECG